MLNLLLIDRISEKRPKNSLIFCNVRNKNTNNTNNTNLSRNYETRCHYINQTPVCRENLFW